MNAIYLSFSLVYQYVELVSFLRKSSCKPLSISYHLNSWFTWSAIVELSFLKSLSQWLGKIIFFKLIFRVDFSQRVWTNPLFQELSHGDWHFENFGILRFLLSSRIVLYEKQFFFSLFFVFASRSTDDISSPERCKDNRQKNSNLSGKLRTSLKSATAFNFSLSNFFSPSASYAFFAVHSSSMWYDHLVRKN